MVISITSKVDVSGPMELFVSLLPARAKDWVKKGAASAAVQLQDMMRDELDRLIYSTPESPTYVRTYTLFRATYAARPGANHSFDHAAAASGVDLRVEMPVAGGIVRLTGYEAEVEVGSWADYAQYVHDGNSPAGQRTPKPFAVRPAKEAARILSREVNAAVAEGLASSIR